MYLEAGQRLLQGKLPYLDFIDLNPPLIFYLSALPVLLGQATGLDVITAFDVWAWFTCVLGIVLTALLFQGNKAQFDARYFGPLIFSIAAFDFLIGEWGEFGQRQHLAAIALAPFIVCRWWRSKNGQVAPLLAVAIGCMFAVMIALVPQYLLIPACTEAIFLFRSRKAKSLIAPEIFVAILIFLAYAIAFLNLPTLVKDSFLRRWAPLTMLGYAAYNCSWTQLAGYPLFSGCIPLFLCGIWLAIKRQCSLTVPLILWCVAAYLVAIIQMKGWPNHFVPLLLGACMLAAVQVDAVLYDQENTTRAIPTSRIFGISALLIALCTMPAVLMRKFDRAWPVSQLQTISRESAPGDQVIILSSNASDVYPALLQAHRKNGSRYLFLFPLQMLNWINENASTEQQKVGAQLEKQKVLDEVAEDIKGSQARLILIPSGTGEREDADSMFARLKEIGFIRKQMSHYKMLGYCQGRKRTFAVFKLIGPNAD